MNTNRVKLFHGSDNIIEKPVCGKGAVRNDYGRGFYCTENIELAKEWACSRDIDGYVNIYHLDLKGLRVLKLNELPYNTLNWLAVLANNRMYWERNSISESAKIYLKENFLVDLIGYDIVIGYRADDSYFTFAKSFVANGISLRQLKEAMRLGEQIVLTSEKAYEQICFLGAEPVASDIYFMKKIVRDKAAQMEYRNRVRKRPGTEELFMIDIMREGIKNGDKRLL